MKLKISAFEDKHATAVKAIAEKEAQVAILEKDLHSASEKARKLEEDRKSLQGAISMNHTALAQIKDQVGLVSLPICL